MDTVHAVLAFPATGQEHRLAVVRVRVEDVSRADAASDVVGAVELTDVVIPAEGAVVPVDVEYDAPPGATALTVRAHGSANGDEGFAAGDFLSTQSLAPQPEVRVPLQAI